jgi:hypothetical protein
MRKPRCQRRKSQKRADAGSGLLTVMVVDTAFVGVLFKPHGVRAPEAPEVNPDSPTNNPSFHRPMHDVTWHSYSCLRNAHVSQFQ